MTTRLPPVPPPPAGDTPRPAERTTPLPPPPPPPPVPAGPARGRRSGAAPWLGLALVLVTALAGYLWVTTTQWQRTSGQWESEAHRHATQVATLDLQLDGANAELAAARDQLATATGRISELANEKAQLGDEQVASQQYLDYQTRVSEAAARVAIALGQCVDGQDQLITYLEDADAYDPDDLRRFRHEVDELCRRAGDANEALQQELDR